MNTPLGVCCLAVSLMFLCNGPASLRAQESAAGTHTFDAADAWAFPAEDDAFTSKAAFDLRALLNEKSAGEHGFVQLSADRMSFVRGDGKPLRFWSVVSDASKLSPENMEHHAAWLAKRGVNMARIHAQICDTKEGTAVTAVDAKVLDGIFRWVAACKRHGIYLVISPYWAHSKIPASWGIDGYAGEAPWGLLFFNPKLQEGYRAWVKALYTTPNPYADHVPLKDEPAVAIAQVKNEDSLLFWTFDSIKPAQRRLLGGQFFKWAIARYRSPDQTLAAWEKSAADGDDIAAGVLGFRSLWELTTRAPVPQGGMARRLADQFEFLTETQRKFYGDMETYFKKDLGIRSLTNAMNWRSVDQVSTDDAERYSYTAMDVGAVNYYTGGAHIGDNNGYRIDPGHKFTNASVLRGDAPLPANLKQTLGHPMVITELAWVHPNLYQSEGPFLMAAYQSLTGVDAACWFAYPSTKSGQWVKDPRAMFWPVGTSHAVTKWYGETPMQAGQFPAFALAYRLGYIAHAKGNAVYEERPIADLWTRRLPLISEAGRFDPNRDSGTFAPDSPVRQEVSRDAFFVGPVVVKYGGEPKNNRVVDLSRYMDVKSGDVRSLTGQLLINQKRGLATLDAPKAQGVCGFLKEAGGTFTLGATRWQSSNAYASLAAVSLDGRDLADSQRILIQAGTTARLTGFTTRDTVINDKEKDKELSGEEILNNGTPPWLVAKTHATLSLSNGNITRATILDPNLYPTGTVPVRREGNLLLIELPTDALYTLLE